MCRCADVQMCRCADVLKMEGKQVTLKTGIISAPGPVPALSFYLKRGYQIREL
jgi:hypothetical protein